MQEVLGRVKEKKHLTLNVIELTVDLVMPSQVPFKAGQFMQFKIGDVLKSYSVAVVPDHAEYFKFCIELLPSGVASDYFRRLHAGDDIVMQGPHGMFTFEQFNRNAFFVATGVGVAPFVSLVPDMLTRGYNAEVTLLFGVRSEEDVFYFDRFNHLSVLYPNFKFYPILSQPKMHWPGEVGRVTTQLDVMYDRHKDCLFYLCGGKEMVGECRDILLKRGHKLEDVKLEVFV